MTNGYDFFFDTPYGLVTFPITPGELSIKVDSNNKVVTLINEGDINIMKSPSLIEVEFEARFPMRNYPYARNPKGFQEYHDIFKKLKEEKKSFRFIVARKLPNGNRTWDTNLLMALESYELDESVDYGDDVLISFKLKQYKEYGVKKINVGAANINPITTSTSNTSRPDSSNKTTMNSSTIESYTVKSGDCLYNIAKKFYGNGALWTNIYNTNKSIIESTAKQHGKSSSSNGHWIYPGCVLNIPVL